MMCPHCGAKQHYKQVCSRHKLPFCWKCGMHLADALKDCEVE